MKDIADSDRTADLARRRERGIEACARIFGVPGKDVPAAMASRVGPVSAEEAGRHDGAGHQLRRPSTRITSHGSRPARCRLGLDNEVKP
jgi:hypothetical protein